MSGTHEFPSFSELTFEVEGGNTDVVLKVHWPGGVSGVTLSAGYDMGSRTAETVKADLVAAGVPGGDAGKLCQGAGKKGDAAKTWVEDNVGTLPKISKDAAKALYGHIYPKYVEKAKNIVTAWGGDWDKYPTRMKEVLTDLGYRGDLADKHKSHLLPSIKNADYKAFCAAIHDLDYWQENTNLSKQKPKGPGGTYKDWQRGGYNWRILQRSDYLKKAGGDTVEEDKFTEPKKTTFALAAMSQDQLYDHLKGVWEVAQKRFGNEGKAEYAFQEDEGKLNLLGARGFDKATMTPVPSTNTKYDDTLFAIYKKDGKKHVACFAYTSEWTREGSLSVLVLGQHKYWINVHHKSAPYVKLSEISTYADYTSVKKGYPDGFGYRALNPDPEVATVHEGDGKKVGGVGHQTTGIHMDGQINVHYGGESLVVSNAKTAWSKGCQVLVGWDNYVAFMRIVEGDKSLKGSNKNELEPPGAGSRSLIYTLVEGDALQPQTLGVSFPCAAAGELKVSWKSAAALYAHTEKDSDGGYFPLGTNRTWHGGLHLRGDKGAPVHAMLDGKIVAARLPGDPMKAMGYFGSTNFILMKHEVTGKVLNIANTFDRQTLIGYTVKATDLALRAAPGKSGSTQGLPRLVMGDEVLLKEVAHKKVDDLFWAHVIVKRSAVPGAENKEGYMSADPKHVNPLYKEPDEVFKPTDKKTFYSLYMHLGSEELLESNPTFASTPWIHRDRFVVTAEALNFRSSPEKPATGTNVIGSLAQGDKLTQRSAPIPDKKDRNLTWVKVSAAKPKDATLKNKEGYVAMGEKFIKKIREPSQWCLNMFAKGEVVKLDDKVKAGAQIWTMGTAGKGTSQSGSLHWEVFSEENLFPKWKKSEDDDDDFNMDVKAIFDMIEQEFWGFDDNISDAELRTFYKTNPKAKELRRWACKFMSEWGVDVDSAVAKLTTSQYFSTSGLADRLRPYSFWKEALDRKVELPASPKVWHYNPITFLYAISRAVEAQTPPRPSGEVPETKQVQPSAKELSGKQWVKRYPTSTSLDDLADPFEAKMKAFMAALKASGAAIRMVCTYRPWERAYLMRYAWDIAKGNVKAKDVPAKEGVPILWDHGDEAKSKAAAVEMNTAYGTVYKPSLTSRHIDGLAVDMYVTWTDKLSIKNASGQTVVITSKPCNGVGNTELHAVAKTYGVIKKVDDDPHWSSDGR